MSRDSTPADVVDSVHQCPTSCTYSLRTERGGSVQRSGIGPKAEEFSVMCKNADVCILTQP